MSIQDDHSRFKDIIKGRIKENFKKHIVNEEMIGKREKEFVKIPIPRIKIPKFMYGPKESGGVGQGDAKDGEPVSGKPGDGSRAGEAGSESADHAIEVEVSIDELAEMLGEELELPRIEPKSGAKINSKKHNYSGISTEGPQSLRHFKRTYKQAITREIISGNYVSGKTFAIPIKKDQRYRSQKIIKEPQARAVVIYMMDVSGSMGQEQKDIVRLESFWINAWLKKNYKGLETRFIIHDSKAKEVDEETFFKVSEAGGTLISAAYQKAYEIIQADYAADQWNTYLFHFSDGDNWSSDDTKLCLKIIEEKFIQRINLFCYGQVESKYGSGQFIKDLEAQCKHEEKIIRSQIKNKEDIPNSIKKFLGKGR